MVINIQFDEAADLLWELFRAVPEERRTEFSERVNRAAACLQHPSNLDKSVVVTIRSDRTAKGAITLRGVVPPLERLEIVQ